VRKGGEVELECRRTYTAVAFGKSVEAGEVGRGLGSGVHSSCTG
jgi:hypothetical protein